jgi:hypothetical protein
MKRLRGFRSDAKVELAHFDIIRSTLKEAES